MNGELHVARELYRRARSTLRDLGQGVNAAAVSLFVAQVELLGGDLERAEREMRSDYDFLAKAGETYYLSSMAALLSRLIRDQGRDDEAGEFSKVAEQATAADDLDSQALWRSIRAPMLARAGQAAEAEKLARAAVELSRQTEAPSLQADALVELASVLEITNQIEEAHAALCEAMALYSTKGNIVSERHARDWAMRLKRA
jgi:ATP/maltotriose-dependent transcriptional regulator MalT